MEPIPHSYNTSTGIVVNYDEYRTDRQVNIGYAQTFRPVNKAPIIAKRIWLTLEDAQDWIGDFEETAIPGLIISVISDPDPSKNGVYSIQVDPSITPQEGQNNFMLVKLSNNSDVNATIGEMNVSEYPQAIINTVAGDETILTIESIQQTNGVIGTGNSHKVNIKIDGIYDEDDNKIATQDTVRELNTTIGDIINTVIGEVNTTIGELTADDISANYNTTAGRIQNTVQGAIDYMTERIQDLESLPTYETIICVNAGNTPRGVTWIDESTTPPTLVEGTLDAGETTMHKIYLVRQHTTGGDIFDEYITIDKGNDQYDWEKIGSTAGVFEGIEEVADGLKMDAEPNTTVGHYIIQNDKNLANYGKLLPAQGYWSEGKKTFEKSDSDGLTMASDVKGYVDCTALITKPFEAIGVTVGNVGNGFEFKYGMTLNEIMEAIFRKEIITKATNPTITFTAKNSNVSYSGTYEVGTVIPTLTLNTTIKTYGYYESYDTKDYPISLFIEKNPGANASGRLNAVCGIVTGPTYKEDGTTISGTSVNSFDIVEGATKTITVNSTLGSSVIPNTNLGNPDTPRQITNTPGNGTITFSGKYKYFYGYCNKRGDGEYSQLYTTKAQIDAAVTSQDLIAGYCEIITTQNPNGETSVAGNGIMKCPSDKDCFVLILPSTHNTILSTNNGMFNIEGEDLINAWGKANRPGQAYNSISYTNGNATTTYYVHVLEADYNLQYEQIKFN